MKMKKYILIGLVIIAIIVAGYLISQNKQKLQSVLVRQSTSTEDEIIRLLKKVFQPSLLLSSFSISKNFELSNENYTTYEVSWNNIQKGSSLKLAPGEYEIMATFYDYTDGSPLSGFILAKFSKNISEVKNLQDVASLMNEYFIWDNVNPDTESYDHFGKKYYIETDFSCMLAQELPGYTCPPEAFLSNDMSKCQGNVVFVVTYVISDNLETSCPNLRINPKN